MKNKYKWSMYFQKGKGSPYIKAIIEISLYDSLNGGYTNSFALKSIADTLRRDEKTGELYEIDTIMGKKYPVEASHVQPNTGYIAGKWGCETIVFNGAAFWAGDHYESMKFATAVLRKLDRVIEKMNLQYKYPGDILAQRIAALNNLKDFHFVDLYDWLDGLTFSWIN